MEGHSQIKYDGLVGTLGSKWRNLEGTKNMKEFDVTTDYSGTLEVVNREQAMRLQ